MVDPNQAFQDLLNALPEESLHVALHNHHPKFQDGVFEGDRTAVEIVHHEDPPLATKLISAAKLDILKRQAGQTNSSGTTPPPATSDSSSAAASAAPSTLSLSTDVSPSSSGAAPASAPASTSSGPPPVIVPVKISTTNSAGKPTVLTTEILSAATASVAIAITTTDSAGHTYVSSTNAPAVIFTTTDSAGSTIVATSAVAFAPTPGQVLTATNVRGSTFLTTYTPGGGTVSSVFLVTTTGPGGKPITLTSYAYVGANPTGTQPGQEPQGTGTSTAKPGLQTGAAGVLSRRWGVEAAAVVGGAVGVAWFL